MAAQTVLPRWRGFNLLELFSRQGPAERRSGAFRKDDREDVGYEDWHGRKLDRALLGLLQRY